LGNIAAANKSQLGYRHNFSLVTPVTK